jgi:hypothetical protein
VLRVRLLPVLPAILIGAALLAAPAPSRTAERPGTLDTLPFPGDPAAVLRAIDDRLPFDRAQFLVEIIRRVHDAPLDVRNPPRDRLLQTLLRELDGPLPGVTRATGPEGAAAQPDNGNGPAVREHDPTPVTLPLPLTRQFWIHVIFDGKATAETLAADILRTRHAGLTYTALLTMDDETRAWFAGEPALLAELASGHAAALLVAAPGLRVADNRMQLPGGDAATAAWESLVGARADQPVPFVRAVVTDTGAHLPYFLGSIARLTPGQIEFALGLAAPEPADRIDAVKRLAAVFDRVAEGWNVKDRAFFRPPLDPALLVADLATDAEGRPRLPGTRRFWNAVFGEPESASSDDDRRGSDTATRAADLPWLSERLFKGSHVVHRQPYYTVLFASRVIRDITPDTEEVAVAAIRALSAYPALIATLERAGLDDVATFSTAARLASRLDRIRDTTRAARALAQFQGALFLVTRAVARGGLPRSDLPQLVTSLAGVELSDRGDYEGRLVAWLARLLNAHAGAAPAIGDVYTDAVGPLDVKALRLLAGRNRQDWGQLEWEGMRYRLDFAAAEAARMARRLGPDARPYLSAAHAVVDAADALSAANPSADVVRAQLASIEAVAGSARWEAEIAESLDRARRSGNPKNAGRMAAALRLLADDLLGRGLTTLAYAASLGHSETEMLGAGEAARRHDFGLRLVGVGRESAWRLPSGGADRLREWHVTGSLLGLDVKLADFALLRLSSRPPARRPSLNDSDRRAFIETVALVDPYALTDADRDTIAAAIRRGRARLDAARTAADAAVLADEIQLSPLHRSLLAWTIDHDPDRVAGLLLRTDLLRLGHGRPIGPESTFHAWGAPTEARTGCLCMRMNHGVAPETLSGRWDSGIFASGFADVNLRYAELLADMAMPASLLAPVLAGAVLDFVNGVDSRDRDDGRSIVAFAEALRPEHLEQFLALLTTDGPLIPAAESEESSEPGTEGGP